MTAAPAAPTARPPIICDLDGVIWLAQRPIAGSAEAIARLRGAGHRVLFVTNNSYSRLEDVVAALAAVGVPARGDVLSSAMAAARLVEPGARALVVGGPGIVQALTDRQVTVLDTDADADAVLVGFNRAFDFESLTRAARAVWRGARLIGTNDDATYPTPDGPIPGCGALLAAVATATGVVPVVAGKPYEPMAALVRAEVGAVGPEAVVIGDRLETDGAFARRLGARFGLVRSGVTTPTTVVEPPPAFDAADLSALARVILADPVRREGSPTS